MKFVLLLMICISFLSCGEIKPNISSSDKSICEIPIDNSSEGFQSGEGTSQKPFIVCSGAQLNLIGNNSVLRTKHFELGQGINMSGVSYNMIAGSAGDEFSGSIEGKGFSISNLTIGEPTRDFVGLIRSNVGSIRNLHLKSVNVRGKGYVGGIVGENFGQIERSSVQGTIIGSQYAIGGIAGYSAGSIRKSYSNYVTAGGNEGVGVFVGVNEGDISNSYAIGNIDCAISPCTGDVYGGFAGYMDDGSITNSYCVSDLMNVTPTLGYGFASYSSGSVSGNFWNGDVYTISEPSVGAELTTMLMKQQTSYVGWDFVNIWDINPAKNNGYPTMR